MTSTAYTWDPFRDIESLFASLDQARSTAGATPGVNIYTDDTSAAVVTELPGVKPDEVQVDLHDDVLTIAANRAAGPAEGLLMRERPDLRFSRSVTLPFQVDPERIEARLKDGVLTVALKRAAADQPRRIQVTAN
jgi:HSP20 family protein